MSIDKEKLKDLLEEIVEEVIPYGSGRSRRRKELQEKILDLTWPDDVCRKCKGPITDWLNPNGTVRTGCEPCEDK